jgi:hypothetical protein
MAPRPNDGPIVTRLKSSYRASQQLPGQQTASQETQSLTRRHKHRNSRNYTTAISDIFSNTCLLLLDLQLLAP